MSSPRELTKVLDRDFLETRSQILSIAAALDRLDRAAVRPHEGPPVDRRLTQLRQAIEALLEPGPGRSETIQRIFSLEYHSHWPADLGLRPISTLNPAPSQDHAAER